jgi:hypothetical protein
MDVRDCSADLMRQFFAAATEAGSDPRLKASLDAVQKRPEALAFAMRRLDQRRSNMRA